jgi:hypothetical protein
MGTLPAGDWNVEITPATQNSSGLVTFHFLKPGIADLRPLLFTGQAWQTTISFPPDTSFFCIEVAPLLGGDIGQLRLQKGADLRTMDFTEDAKFVWQVTWP